MTAVLGNCSSKQLPNSHHQPSVVSSCCRSLKLHFWVGENNKSNMSNQIQRIHWIFSKPLQPGSPDLGARTSPPAEPATYANLRKSPCGISNYFGFWLTFRSLRCLRGFEPIEYTSACACSTFSSIERSNLLNSACYCYSKNGNISK